MQAHNALMLGVTMTAVAAAANLLLSAQTHAMYSVAGPDHPCNLLVLKTKSAIEPKCILPCQDKLLQEHTPQRRRCQSACVLLNAMHECLSCAESQLPAKASAGVRMCRHAGGRRPLQDARRFGRGLRALGGRRGCFPALSQERCRSDSRPATAGAVMLQEPPASHAAIRSPNTCSYPQACGSILARGTCPPPL